MQWNENVFRALTRSPYVQSVVMGVTEETAQDLRKNAPVDTEAYRNSISTAMKFQDRAVGLMLVSDPKVMIIEAQQAPMVKALNRAKQRHRG